MVSSNQQKITINSFPNEFKDMALEIKDDLKISLNSVYIEIFREYYNKREAQKLKKSAEIMANIYKEDEELKDWSNFVEDIHEY